MYLDGDYRFDIGIIDLCMPKMDGHELAKRIRDKDHTFPMILMASSYIEDHDDFDNYIIKPVKENKLLNILINLFNHKEAHIEMKNTEESKQLKILLAEDMYMNQKVVIGFLKKFGQEDITVVENGRDTIEAVKLKKYDLLLLDIKMPYIDGETAAKEINSKYSHNRPFIVALTANVMNGDKEHYIKECGMDGYLPKPIDIDKLKTIIDRVLNLK